jgi:fatty acid desaturase
MGRTIAWYRTPLEPELLTRLSKRSDVKGAIQAGGHLAVMAATGTVCIYCAVQGWWSALVAALVAHGMVCAFTINGVHELVHNTVFRTRWLNAAVAYIYAFIGWHNHFQFWGSHAEHHMYTLHPPDDLEVVLPEIFTVGGFFTAGIVNLPWLRSCPKTHWEFSRGRFASEWDKHCFPASNPDRRRPVIWWSRYLLAGHFVILVASVVTGYWIIPVVVSLTPLYGAWLFWLCNNTQHCGLVDEVPDFRLCSRTFYLNPVVRFLYWQMNHHTEHHMYTAVPCYNLAKLHEAVKHDLPPTPHGLLEVWTQIGRIMQRQRVDPSYQYAQPLPLLIPGGAR